MIGGIPEGWVIRLFLIAPEAFIPMRVGTGQQGVFEHVDSRAELPPQSSAQRRLHRVFSHNVSSLYSSFLDMLPPKAVKRCPHIPRIAQRASNLWQSSLNMCLFKGKEPMYSPQGGTYDQYRRWSRDHPDRIASLSSRRLPGLARSPCLPSIFASTMSGPRSMSR